MRREGAERAGREDKREEVQAMVGGVSDDGGRHAEPDRVELDRAPPAARRHHEATSRLAGPSQLLHVGVVVLRPTTVKPLINVHTLSIVINNHNLQCPTRESKKKKVVNTLRSPRSKTQIPIDMLG